MNPEKLKVLREHPYFQELLKELKQNVPIVPDFDPGSPESGEMMKALSMKRQGFLFALSLIGATDG